MGRARHRARGAQRGAAGLLAIALCAGSIDASAGPARVRLAYRAPTECPGEGAFLAAVIAQARPFERAPRSAARARSLDAEIRRGSADFSGLLRVREADGSTSEREVHGPACEDVMSALALVAAITIDTGPAAPTPLPIADPPAPEAPSGPRWGVATSVSSGVYASMSPTIAIGVSPALELSPPLGTPFDVRLGFTFAASPRAETAVGSADFFWLAAHVDAAPLTLARGSLSLGLVFGADAGAVLGRGIGVWLGRETWRAWLDLGVGLRGAAMLTPTFGVELGGGMLVPITRDTWVFERPDAIIHQTPPVGGYATLGIRVRLHR